MKWTIHNKVQHIQELFEYIQKPSNIIIQHSTICERYFVIFIWEKFCQNARKKRWRKVKAIDASTLIEMHLIKYIAKTDKNNFKWE